MTKGLQTSATIRWITSGDIKIVNGAHKPSAYVARAYAYQKKHDGILPEWAQKSPDGHWLFDEAYVVSSAHDNLDHVGISEAARLLGVTRRTVQTWVDEDIIPVSEHRPGEERRILRSPFMKAIPELKRRLETAPVVGYRIKHGIPVENDVLQKIDIARTAQETERKQSRKVRARRDTESRLRSRLEKKSADREAQLAVRMNRKLAAAEKTLNNIRKHKATIEHEVRKHTEHERLESERSRAINSEYEAKLAASAQMQQKSCSRRQRSERKLKRKTETEAETATEVEALRRAVSAQIDSYRSQSARAIATQLRDARDAVNAQAASHQDNATPDESSRVKKSAEAVAQRLRQAREACAHTAASEEEAVRLATGIVDDMPDESMDRIDGAILFNDVAERRGIPYDIRIKITRQFFSRRA